MTEPRPVQSTSGTDDLLNEVSTRSGVVFDASQDVWHYRDGVSLIRLDFRDVPVTPAMRRDLKRVLTWYAEQLSPSHTRNMFHRFRHFAASVLLDSGDIKSTHLINYRNTLNAGNCWYLTNLSGFLKRWHGMGIPGVSDDAMNFLGTVRLKGNRKGIAVLTMDPQQGRFTDTELEGICAQLSFAYETGVIRLDEYVLALLFIALGPRPIQFAAMKVRDVTAYDKADQTTYLVSIPRAKKRQQDPRASFRKRTLVPSIGVLLHQHASEIRKQFAAVLSDPEDAPLFPGNRRGMRAPAGFEYHRTSNALGTSFENTMSKLEVLSERTGAPININPTRFRRTLACRAADEGHGELVIADLLDHEDTQNVGVYTEATPGMIERIDRAVALKLAPLAQAFAGKIITDESKARRADDPTSRIRDPHLDTDKPVGSCGKFGFCGLLAPVACYTCQSFEPWLDGPHERVLDYLIAERDRLLVDCDKRIASVNDRTILAVADVVRRCVEINKERKGGLHG